MTNLSVILEQVRVEREAQDSQWGGPTHDEHHNLREWCGFIEDHVKRAKKAAASMRRGPLDGIAIHRDDFRKQMIEIAALAVAAVESIDRKRSRDESVEP